MELHGLELGALSTAVQGEGPAPWSCLPASARSSRFPCLFRLSDCGKELNSVEMGYGLATTVGTEFRGLGGVLRVAGLLAFGLGGYLQSWWRERLRDSL